MADFVKHLTDVTFACRVFSLGFWFAALTVIVAVVALLLKRLTLARAMSSAGIVLGLIALAADATFLLALYRLPELVFFKGITAESVTAMQPMIAPSWLKAAVFDCLVVVASMGLRLTAVRKLRRSNPPTVQGSSAQPEPSPPSPADGGAPQ